MIVAIVLTFWAVFLVVISLCLGIAAVRDSSRYVVKRRLRRMAIADGPVTPPETSRNKILRGVSPLDRGLARMPLLRNLKRLIEQAGVHITSTALINYVLAASFAACGALYFFTHRIAPALAALVVVPGMAVVYLNMQKQRRQEKFTQQMPDALNIISRSLRSGHSTASAVELAGNECAHPLGGLFKMAYEQQKLGLGITETLTNMTSRIESLDLRFFIATITINRETGGNLAEMLDHLADTIRERIKIRRQVKVYTAHGRLSGYILAAMPIVVFFAMNLVTPDYEKVLLTRKMGQILLAGAFVMQLIGFFTIKRITNIKI